jgi:hypothetical protein
MSYEGTQGRQAACYMSQVTAYVTFCHSVSLQLESHPRAKRAKFDSRWGRVFELSRKQWQEGFGCVHRSRPRPGGEMAWSVAPIPNSSGVGVPHAWHIGVTNPSNSITFMMMSYIQLSLTLSRSS